MTKKQIIEQLKENMPEFKSEGVRRQIQIALYAYIKLGQMKDFDERYYFGNSETRRKIYNLSQREREEPDKMSERKKLICVGLAYLYKSILEEFGIKAEVAKPDPNDEHELAIVVTSDGARIKADLQEDLHNIKTKSKLQFFGTEDSYVSKSLHIISEEELRTLCEQVGYISPGQEYKDEVIEELKNKANEMTPHKILETILNDERIYGDSDIPYYELYRYYSSLLKNIVPKKVRDRINYFTCYTEEESIDEETKNKNRQYTMCAYSVEKDGIKAYMYSKGKHRFLPIELKRIRQLESQGLVLGSRNKEKGVNLLRRYMRESEKEEAER